MSTGNKPLPRCSLLVPRIAWTDIVSEMRDHARGMINPWQLMTGGGQEDDFWSFLADIGFWRDRQLTDVAKAYLQEATIRNDHQAARAILGDALKRSAAARLVCSVLAGCSAVGRENVVHLLELHGWHALTEQEENDSGDLVETWERTRTMARTAVYHFLHLLNEAGLVAYSKKNDRLRIIWNPDADARALGSMFISPSTPYSNVSRLRQLFASLRGEAIWIDRHFDRKGFEVIAESLDASRVPRFIILSGTQHCNDKAKRDYRRLKEELSIKGTKLEWRILSESVFAEIHDRWLLDKQKCWNMPPVNTIFANNASEILESANRPDIKAYLHDSVPLDNDRGVLDT